MPTDLTQFFETSDRILVFGGPYSNLQATQALRLEALRLGIAPEHSICTGDVVAYCANPVETVTEIRDWGVHVVAGNCEQQLAASADNCACGFDEGSACDVLAKGWFAYADQRIGAADRSWMRELPDEATFSWAGKTLRVVHGTREETSKFLFPSEHDAIAEQLEGADADIVIAGHCGIPFGQLATTTAGRRLWFNAGVIGQPANDGTTDVWYGILTRTAEGLDASLHRLSYDAATASTAVLQAGYADPYGETLKSGIWPNDDILPTAEKALTGVRLPEQTFGFVSDPAKTAGREQAA